jgi:hypothetical protein
MHSALEDKEKPFLHPRQRAIIPVPLQFHSVQQYCALIAHNLLAEFYHVYREGPKGGGMRGMATGGALMVEGANVEDGMMQHLISVGGSLHIVTNQTLTGLEGMALTVKPKLQAHGSVQVKSYGYIGSYMSGNRAATAPPRPAPRAPTRAPAAARVRAARKAEPRGCPASRAGGADEARRGQHAEQRARVDFEPEP